MAVNQTIGKFIQVASSRDFARDNLFRIMQLNCRNLTLHSASMEEDYLTIEEMALTEKKNKVFDKWMKEKIDGLYIFIDPDFRDGEFEYPNWVK